MAIIIGILIAGCSLHLAGIIANGVIRNYRNFKEIAQELIPVYGLYKTLRRGLNI